jgi:dolichol-phosphate mannosyltransferase
LTQGIDVSVVIPIYNERENIEELLQRVLKALRSTGRRFEVLAVDDGSSDGTTELLTRIARREPEVKAIVFRRNFGQSAAMTAGFQQARGDIVVSMDGDLQNDPDDIPRLIAKLEEGYDMVSGWRKERQDAFLSMRLPSRIANWIIGRATGVRLHDYGCSLKAYRSDITRDLILYGELHRFIPVLASLKGARFAEIVVKHHPRTRGKSKYGIGRTFRVILDLLLMLFFQKFATRPLQLFGLAGGGMFLTGFLIELYLTFLKLFMGQQIGNRPLLFLGMLLIITGIMLLGIGLLAELVIRTYYESSGKHIYAIREIVG